MEPGPWAARNARGVTFARRVWCLSLFRRICLGLLRFCVCSHPRCGHSRRRKLKTTSRSMTFDGGILLESWTVARLSAKTVLSQELSSHIAGALETLAPQLVMTSNLEKGGWWAHTWIGEITRLSQTVHSIAGDGLRPGLNLSRSSLARHLC